MDIIGIGLGLVWGVTVRLFFLARLAVGCPASPGFRPGLGRDRPGNFFSKVTREGYLSAQRHILVLWHQCMDMFGSAHMCICSFGVAQNQEWYLSTWSELV